MPTKKFLWNTWKQRKCRKQEQNISATQKFHFQFMKCEMGISEDVSDRKSNIRSDTIIFSKIQTDIRGQEE